MKKNIIMAIFVIWSCNANAVLIYDVNRTIGSGTVSGTVTTDGTLGVLATSNFIAWSLTIFSPTLNGGPTEVLSESNSGAGVGGSALTASLTDLTFDFLTSGPAQVFFQNPSTGTAWCMSGPLVPCLSGTPTPGEGIYFDSVDPLNTIRFPTSAEKVATSTAAPEPTTLALLSLGFIGIGAARKLKKH